MDRDFHAEALEVGPSSRALQRALRQFEKDVGDLVRFAWKYESVLKACVAALEGTAPRLLGDRLDFDEQVSA